jgi:hypothetical protein
MDRGEVMVEVPAKVALDASGQGAWVAQACGCGQHEPFNGLFAWGSSRTQAIAGLAELMWLIIDQPVVGPGPRPTEVVIRATTITTVVSTETFRDPSLPAPPGTLSSDASLAPSGGEPH